MLILLNHPLVSLVLFALLILLVKSNKNKHGIAINLKGYERLIGKNDGILCIVDIRSEDRFAEYSAEGSQHFSKVDLSKNDKKKIIIIHDSDLELANYFRKNKLKTFSDHIYQTNVIDHNLRQYQSAVGGLMGNDLSALMKNSDSIS